jgi:hypothetical protein
MIVKMNKFIIDMLLSLLFESIDFIIESFEYAYASLSNIIIYGLFIGLISSFDCG